VKPVRILPHAIQNLRDRGILLEEVERTIEKPEFIVAGYDERQVYMRRYHDATLDQEMLLRVIVEERETERVIVTVYKTSQIERYLKGLKP
jgi:hypothetical protein